MSESATTPAAGGNADEITNEIDESRMTLAEHLNELRSRLVRSLIVFAVAFSALYAYHGEVAKFVCRPQVEAKTALHEKLDRALATRVLDGELEAKEYFVDGLVSVDDEGNVTGQRIERPEYAIILKADAASGPFGFYIKVCFLAALAIAIPVALWELWGFIAAGLYKHERRVAYWYLPPAILLFYAGITFGYLVMVPAALYFTQGMGLGTEPLPVPREVSLDDYLKFVRGLCLALGIIFQIPIIQLMLAKTGIVHPSVFAKYRGHMAVALLVFAALITPPDPMTQMLLAGPAIILWEIGYWVARLTTKDVPEPFELEPA